MAIRTIFAFPKGNRLFKCFRLGGDLYAFGLYDIDNEGMLVDDIEIKLSSVKYRYVIDVLKQKVRNWASEGLTELKGHNKLIISRKDDQVRIFLKYFFENEKRVLAIYLTDSDIDQIFKIIEFNNL